MRASREESGLRRRFTVRAASGLVVAGLAFALVTGIVTGSGAATEPAKPAAAPVQPVAAPVKPEAAATKVAPAPVKPTAAPAAVPSVARPSAPTVPAARPAGVTAPAGGAPSRAVPKGGSVTPNDKLGPDPKVASAPARSGAAPVASGSAVPRAQAPVGPPKSALIQSSAILDQHVTYQYNALGRRDPFQPILGGEFIGNDVGGDAPVDVGGIKVVGIMWGTNDKFALVEDGRGNSLVLRAGDKVMNGVVESLQREAVVVKLTVDGQTQSVAIPLTRKGDQNASR